MAPAGATRSTSRGAAKRRGASNSAPRTAAMAAAEATISWGPPGMRSETDAMTKAQRRYADITKKPEAAEEDRAWRLVLRMAACAEEANSSGAGASEARAELRALAADARKLLAGEGKKESRAGMSSRSEPLGTSITGALQTRWAAFTDFADKIVTRRCLRPSRARRARVRAGWIPLAGGMAEAAPASGGDDDRPAEPSPTKDTTYYNDLGVPFDATDEEIKRAFHTLVRTHHPDRRLDPAPEKEMDRLRRAQTAWKCLSDPTRRLAYDLRTFRRSASRHSGVAEQELLAMQKEQAATDIRNMEYGLERSLRKERAVKGIIIRSALYGDLRLKPEQYQEGMLLNRTIRAEDLIGPFIDVTLPVQSFVEGHKIQIPGGAFSSKSDLPGFYNPVPLDFNLELHLYVLYDFRGQLHEVIVGDRCKLIMPYRKHTVPPGRDPRGPFSPANLTAPTAIRKGEASERAAQKALEDAAVAYRFHALADRDPTDATPSEFLAVLAASGLAMACCWWAADGARRPAASV
eukprot:TRINITY_DN11606_c0_g1_i2.p1 TRINITY_DN11606_c0_g1~~TRINITY_DN11606_c0_g1_i2.p1  ORF type:complete len:555 (+),score=84.56 TRINITY_DN11606_c0_g1_i2:107-1666(+)